MSGNPMLPAKKSPPAIPPKIRRKPLTTTPQVINGEVADTRNSSRSSRPEIPHASTFPPLKTNNPFRAAINSRELHHQPLNNSTTRNPFSGKSDASDSNNRSQPLPVRIRQGSTSSSPVESREQGRPKFAGQEKSIFIGVVGITGSGKSTFINRITGCETILAAAGYKSGTRTVNQAHLQLDSALVTLVDTPGFNDSEKTDDEIYYMIVDWLKEFHEKGQKLSGLIYLHPINKTREKGSDVRSLKIFKKLVGRDNFENILIGITFHDREGPAVVAARERSLKESSDFWADMVRAGASVVRIPYDKQEGVYDREGCIALIAQMAGRKPITLQAERELFEEHRAVEEMSAMEEMQDHHELKILQVREEMELAAQQMLFDERVRLTTQFSSERATLEEQLFQLKQEKQILQTELLTCQNECEQGKSDMAALRLQHDREDQLRKQKIQQTQREKDAKEEREKSIKSKRELQEKEEKAYAVAQVVRANTWAKSKVALLNKYMSSAPGGTVQKFAPLYVNVGEGSFALGSVCGICYKLVSTAEPYLCYHKGKEADGNRIGFCVCASRTCLAESNRLLNEHEWDRTWYFVRSTTPIDCSRLKESSGKFPKGLLCSICLSDQNKISGFYMHCCECDGDNFDICLECWCVKRAGCRSKDKHLLRLAVVEEIFKLTR